MGNSSPRTATAATPPPGKGKRRRRPATGPAEAYRKNWGREWGQFMHQQSEKLRAESEGAQ